MLRLSTTRLPLLAGGTTSSLALRSFHSNRYNSLPETTTPSNDSTNLTPAARRRLQPDPEFTSSSSSASASASAAATKPGPNPISPPPDSPPPPSATSQQEQEQQPQHKRRVITSVNELPPSFGRNQIISIPTKIEQDLQTVLSAFKKSPIRFAFAYGSGVFRQSGYTEKDQPLLDFVFAVSHPSHWHAINMQQHPHHYSGLMRLLGSNAVSWLQEKGLGASVWFNVEVEIKGKIVKYGCISIDSLCRDMLDWETLYISGRTQKPVKILLDDARVRLANQVNLASSLRTSLLLLPESFTEIELFETIAGLSYRGDFRMKVGENPHKVRNIVKAQLDSFRSLYGGLLKSFWKSVHTIGESDQGVRLMRQDLSVNVRASTASRLPRNLRDKVLGHYERKFNLEGAIALSKAKGQQEKEDQGELIDLDQQKLWERIVQDPEFQSIVSKSIGQIVARPTFNQSLKGILSAGILRSLRYVIPKLKKKFSAAK